MEMTELGGERAKADQENLNRIDLVETDKESNAISVVILVCLLLTLLFDTFLIAIILLHDDLRRKARIS